MEVYVPPIVNGFDAYTENSNHTKMRLLVYAKNNIKAVRQEHEVGWDCSIHFVCLQMSTTTIVAIYNQHTQNAYTKYHHRLTRRQMYTKFTGTVEYFLAHANTKNPLVIGDVNVRWEKNEMSVCDWASRIDLIEFVKEPTRENAILDRVYTRTRCRER